MSRYTSCAVLGVLFATLIATAPARAEEPAPAPAPAAAATTPPPAAVAPAAIPQPKPPLGRWKTIDDETGLPKSIVVIWEEKGKLFGKVDKLIRQAGDEEHPKCDKCEGANKDKPVLGLTIMWDLEKDDDEWSGGEILDPKNGKTYKCTIEVVDNGARLKVRGYIGFSLIGRSQYWLREK